MNNLLRLARFSTIGCLAWLALAISGCGGTAGKSKLVEDYLGKLEKTVVHWETKLKSGAVTLYEFGELNKASVDLIGEGKLLQINEVWSDEQRRKFADLSGRFSKVMMELCANPKLLK
ncbi:MAG: hypothetical protein N3B01_09545 [Verrucomicrobiae bacterium]|nr:hypothetical protein [Verrucomicrobiae bacterium]